MLVRNLSTVPLNLRKGGQKYVLLPGKVVSVPDVLFTKEQIKTIYGSFVQILNEELKVVDTPSKDVSDKKVEAPLKDNEAPVEENAEKQAEEDKKDETEKEPVEELLEESGEEKDAEVEETIEDSIEELLEEAKKPAKKPAKKAAKNGSKKATKK